MSAPALAQTFKHQALKGRKGIFSRLSLVLQYNALGDILVKTGHLTPEALYMLLEEQKKNGGKVGQLAIRAGHLTPARLFVLLFSQKLLRSFAATLALMLTLTVFTSSKARAKSSIRDIPALLQVSHTPDYDKFRHLRSYPPLFGMQEVSSSNLQQFFKWTGMFARFDEQIGHEKNKDTIDRFRSAIGQFSGREMMDMIRGVNKLVNSVPYVEDSRNWGVSDYWATPFEFMRKGGDCEDYAITKYTALRALGMPESRLRLAIVKDLVKGIPHAVLIVYTDEGAVILDNQDQNVRFSEEVYRYRPYFSLNRHAWWLHRKATQPVTVIAAAN